MKDDLLEKMCLDIPYDSKGFKNCLITSQTLSEREADKQVDLIREADIELWEPGEPELFKLLGVWLEEARKASSETLRSLWMDFAFTLLVTHIRELQELEKEADNEGRIFLSKVIKSFELYESFLRATLNYYEYDEELYSEDAKPTRYPKIPLDDEFNEYLKESRFSDGVRYKMMSNLRKLNSLIINNRRGESDWLQSIVDRVKAGVNIRYTRLIANHVVHAAIENIDEKEGMTEDALRGALSALNHYLDYLIKRYLKNKNP